jgi:hypothetical protein
MGSATSIPAEPIVAAAAVVGMLGYGYAHFVLPTVKSDGSDADGDATIGMDVSSATASVLHGQKKRGRKLLLPGDATLKNLDVLDAPGPLASRPVSASAREPTPISATRQRPQPPKQQSQQQQPQQQQQQQQPGLQFQHVVPGGFDGAVASSDDVRDAQQQQQQQPVKKQKKKKKGKKANAVSVLEELSSASASTSAAVTSQLVSGSTDVTTRSEDMPTTVARSKKGLMSVSVVATDAQDERWTRVEARRKKAAPLRTTTTDTTTSDAGITTSVTGNSSPITERTTEDELLPEFDGYVVDSLYPVSCARRLAFLLRMCVGVFLQECAGSVHVIFAGRSTSRGTRASSSGRAAREGLYVG